MICDIISSLAIVVSLFRLHTCQLTLNMLFFIKIPGSLYSITNCFILTNAIAAISRPLDSRSVPKCPFVSKREMF